MFYESLEGRALDENGNPLILTTREVQENCPHDRGRHVSSFSSRVLVCNKCRKFFDRYETKEA